MALSLAGSRRVRGDARIVVCGGSGEIGRRYLSCRHDLGSRFLIEFAHSSVLVRGGSRMNRIFVLLAVRILSTPVLADRAPPKTQPVQTQPTPTAMPTQGDKAPMMVSLAEVKWVGLPEL